MNRLRDLREDRDLTQEYVGKQIGVSKQVMSNYERGERALNPDLICKFCDFYRVTADYLLGRSNQAKPEFPSIVAEYVDAFYAAPEEIQAKKPGNTEFPGFFLFPSILLCRIAFPTF